MNLQAIKTVNGHPLPEVVSALQKSIRRGHVDDAMYFATDMYLSGYAEYAWKRLRIITSEDVGLADLDMRARIQALYALWVDMKKKKDEYQEPERLFLVHAVILLARAPKNRTVDDALVFHWGQHANIKRDIPDYAIDRHTARGKQLGRGVEHVFEVGYHLEHQVGDNPYRDCAQEHEYVVEAGKAHAKRKPAEPAQKQLDLDIGTAASR